jgi:hypothetical protein
MNKIYQSFKTMAEANAKAKRLRDAGLFAGVKCNPRAKVRMWQVYGPKYHAISWQPIEN